MALTEGQWKHFRYFSKDPHKIIEKVQGEVLIADVPRVCFSGTQRLLEYSRVKERRVKSQLQEKGIDFLRQWPVVACALPVNTERILTPDFYDDPFNSYQLVLLDGHHRVRYGSIYGISEVPTIILSLSQTATAYKIDSLDKMAGILTSWMDEALESFSKKMPYLKPPLPITFKQGPNGLLPIKM